MGRGWGEVEGVGRGCWWDRVGSGGGKWDVVNGLRERRVWVKKAGGREVGFGSLGNSHFSRPLSLFP